MNKNFIKIIAILLLSFIIIFTGCNNNGNELDNSNLKKGSITIAIPLNSEEEQVLNAVVEEYQNLNPFVNIAIDAKSGSDYKDLISQALTASDMNQVTMDIIRNNEVSQYYGSNKFIDFSQYLDEFNSYYDNLSWKDTMDTSEYKANGAIGQVYSLNFETTQVLIYSNKNVIMPEHMPKI